MVPFVLIDKYRKKINAEKPNPKNPCTNDPFLNFYNNINKQLCCPLLGNKINNKHIKISYEGELFILSTNNIDSQKHIINIIINKDNEFKLLKMYTKDYNIPELNLVLFRKSDKLQNYYPVQILKKYENKSISKEEESNIIILKTNIYDKELI